MRDFILGVYVAALVVALLLYLDELGSRISDLEVAHVASKPPEPVNE